MSRLRSRPVWACLATSLVVVLGSVASLIGLGVSARAGASEPVRIAWRTDPAQAAAEARASQRLLWFQFTGPWCQHCRRMDQGPLTDRRIIELARAWFIPVKLCSDVHEALALSLGLSVLPSTVVLRPSGEVVATHEGYADAETFQRFMTQALEREGLGAPRTVDREPPEAAARSEPTRQPALALSGHCPVTLVGAHRLVAGRASLTFEYAGTTYRFASSEALATFQDDPERFVPVNAGQCPVRWVDQGEEVAGSPRWGALYQGRLFLCADAEARDRFLANPKHYAHAELADDGFCPHCRHVSGLLVRGLSEFSTTYAGRRYLFPNASHLEAFRASPETYLR